TLWVTNAASSWVVGFSGHRTATNNATAPSGMTAIANSASKALASDTNATVTTWATAAVTVNANSGWRAYAIELRIAPPSDAGAPSPDYLVQSVQGSNNGGLPS